MSAAGKRARNLRCGEDHADDVSMSQALFGPALAAVAPNMAPSGTQRPLPRASSGHWPGHARTDSAL